MNHTEKIIDTNSIFEIDAITRTIKNTSNSKITIIQHDHDSERFTFKIPRYIENHDMKECNLVEVHYVNVDSTTNEEKKDRYIVKDLKVDEDSENMMKFTWLLSEKATSQVGSLRFAVRFSCVLEDGKVEYAWNTAPYKDITVTTGLYNKEEIRSDAISDLFARIDKIETTGGTGSGGGNVEIVDNLTTDDDTKALSARQGKVLNETLADLKTETVIVNLSIGDYELIADKTVSEIYQSHNEGKDIILKIESIEIDINIGDRRNKEEIYKLIGTLGENMVFVNQDIENPLTFTYITANINDNTWSQSRYVAEGGNSADLSNYFTKDETLQQLTNVAETARHQAENEVKIALENYYDKEAIDVITEPLSEIVEQFPYDEVIDETVGNSSLKEGATAETQTYSASGNIAGYTQHMTKDVMFGESNVIYGIYEKGVNINAPEGQKVNIKIEFRRFGQSDIASNSEVAYEFYTSVVSRGKNATGYVFPVTIKRTELTNIDDGFVIGIRTTDLSEDGKTVLYPMIPSYNSDGILSELNCETFASSNINFFKKIFYYNNTDKLNSITVYPATKLISSDFLFLTSMKKDYSNLMDNINNTTKARLVLPEKYDLIVGDTFELFKKCVVNCINPDIYDWEFIFKDGGNYGYNYERKYMYEPAETHVGKKIVTIRLKDNVGNICDENNVIFNIINPPTSPTPPEEGTENTKTTTILCMGDSLVDTGVWPHELHRRLTANNGTPKGYGLNNIIFIGDCEKDGTKYEGYGGATFDFYLGSGKRSEFQYIYGDFSDKDPLTDQHSMYQDENGEKWLLEDIREDRIKIILKSSGLLPNASADNPKVLTWVSGGTNTGNIIYTSNELAPGNPFVNLSTDKIDYAAYKEKQGVTTIDHIIIELGWNHSGISEESYKEKCCTLLDNLLSAYPECKITLLGLIVLSRDGMGQNYGVSWDYWTKLQHVWNVQKWQKDICSDDKYKERVECVNIAGQLDVEYNMQLWQRDANVRNSTKIKSGGNGLHPAESGYMQIADAVLRNICTKL